MDPVITDAVGISPAWQKVLDLIGQIAPTSATVLIQGETGTGKELVAKALHTNSPRKNKPFVAMNCTAVNENLLEDELFGHDPGSFTGADRPRKGRFEYANSGTLCLDEVGDTPPTLQVKLLRVLENKEVFRIGSNEAIKVNVRLLSATNRDLEAAVAAGSFRKDLYFRLKVVTIKLPPLRERREDVPLLAAHFIKEFNDLHGKKVTGISDAVSKRMATYDWPGNVRELRNLIESMIVHDRDQVLELDDLQGGDGLRPISDQSLDSSKETDRCQTGLHEDLDYLKRYFRSYKSVPWRKLYHDCRCRFGSRLTALKDALEVLEEQGIIRHVTQRRHKIGRNPMPFYELLSVTLDHKDQKDRNVRF